MGMLGGREAKTQEKRRKTQRKFAFQGAGEDGKGGKGQVCGRGKMGNLGGNGLDLGRKFARVGKKCRWGCLELDFAGGSG